MINRILRAIGIGNLFSFGLLSAAFLSITYGLSRVIRSLSENPIHIAIILALGFGWLLAKSRLSLLWSALIAISTGIAAIVIYFARLSLPLLSYLWSWVVFSFQLWRWQQSWQPAPFPNLQPLALSAGETWTALQVLFDYLNRWIGSLVIGQPFYDRLATQLLWSFVFWLCAVWASWAFLRYHRVLAGIAPGCLLLAFMMNYVRADTLPLFPFLAAILLLMTLAWYTGNAQRWRTKQIDSAENIGAETAIAAMIITAVLIGVAFLADLAPTISFDSILDLWRPKTPAQAQIGESLGLETKSEPPSAFNKWGIPALPRKHLLGAPPDLLKEVVLVVEVDDPQLSPPDTNLIPGEAPAPPSYYWKGLTYDQYTGNGWTTGPFNESEYEADTTLYMRIPAQQRLINQHFRYIKDQGGLLFTSGSLISVDQKFRTAIRPVPEWKGAPAYAPEAEVDLFAATLQPLEYNAQGMKPVISEETLRRAGEIYPDWIRQRYLVMPEKVPERLLTLAYTLTQSAPTVYDEALAIESYLRKIPYSLDVPQPPYNRDVADYFIFDLRKGYCDYYATAMVLLARARSLPARMVIGYAGGVYDTVNKRYVVTEADAHSWVEIYFPGIGWVEFEPTAGRPAIERPDKAPPVEEAAFTPNPKADKRLSLDWNRLAENAVALALLALAPLAAWFLFDEWRLLQISPQNGIITVYRRLYRASRQLAGPFASRPTPLEFGRSLQGVIENIARQKMWKNTFFTTGQDIQALTDLYVQTIYSSHPPSRKDKARALLYWGRLRTRLWVAKTIFKFSSQRKQNGADAQDHNQYTHQRHKKTGGNSAGSPGA